MKQRRFLLILGILVLTLSLLAATTVLASSQGVERLNGAPGLPNNSFPPPPMAEQVQDGSFEAGSPNPFWTESSTNFGTPLCSAGTCGTGGGTAGPNSGAWWAWFGGIGAYEEGAVSQMVTIPAGTTTMTWYQMLGACSGMAQDYLEVNIDGTQEYVIDATDASCGVLTHSQQSIDISAYADGGSHTIEFHSEVFGTGGTTNFSVDDVSIVAPDPLPSIVMTKTVGVVPGVCATTSSITVPGAGADVYYCYEVMNTGNVTLGIHDLVDDQLGQLLSGFMYDLGPGQSVDSVAAGLVASATITQTTVNSATWTAFNNSQETASSSSSATVTVSSTPTSVSLSGIGGDSSASTPIMLGALVLLVVGLGLAMRRKFTA